MKNKETIQVVLMPRGYGKANKEVREYIHLLEQENKKLKDEKEVLKLKLEECEAGCKRFYEDKIEIQHRIDKAINYIMDNASYFIDGSFCASSLYPEECEKLIDILNGEDNDCNANS